MKIDVHTHILPREVPRFKERFGYGGFGGLSHAPGCCSKLVKDDGTFVRNVEPNLWDPEERIKECDSAQVTVQVLSTVPIMFSYWAKPEHAIELCRELNDSIADVVRRFPRRFVGLAHLPMQAPKLAVQELERSMKLGLSGAEIGTHINQWNLSDPALFPFFEAAESLGAALFVHPWDMMGMDRMQSYWLPWLVAMPAEVSLAICSMIFGGVFTRFPKLRVCFAHGGGSFPGTFGRIEQGFVARPDLCAVDSQVPPREFLGKFFVDSITHSAEMLRYLIKLLGKDRIALGSDYPFPLGEARAGTLVESMHDLTDEVRDQLLCRNALLWLGKKRGFHRMTVEAGTDYALEMDQKDPLRAFREKFHIPPSPSGGECIYLAGNSLGLQPKKTRECIEAELDDWAKLGVEGHFRARHPWLPYHENLTEQTARLVGAKPIEVVVMNGLSVNLHLMMVSFYRPTLERFKILIEGGPFPSDRYAVSSQAIHHGFDPKAAVLELRPREGEDKLRDEDILETIAREGKSIALVLIGSPNYLTGQAFDIEAITRAAHAQGCKVGFDLAHGAGNLELSLHDSGPDFAVWCSYKYLNAGPGGAAGVFVHERHARDGMLPRFSGWWGQNKEIRFKMGPVFDPIPGAEGWQLSNPPIFQLASLRASMEIFDEATMARIRAKGDTLTAYLEKLLVEIPGGFCTILTPNEPKRRGSQLSMRIKGDPKMLLKRLGDEGVICDFREPNVIRAAPAPLYNRFADVHRFAEILRGCAG